MLKQPSSKLLLLLLAGTLTACGGNNTASTPASGGTAPITAQAPNTTAPPATVATPQAKVAATTPTPAPKPANTGPQRIAFNKGANWGATNITLPPGGSQKFVVGAKAGQVMDVEVSSKDTSVNLIQGKADTTEDFGYLNAALKSNGDYVFEVRNSGKKELKTSVKVTIEGGAGAETP